MAGIFSFLLSLQSYQLTVHGGCNCWLLWYPCLLIWQEIFHFSTMLKYVHISNSIDNFECFDQLLVKYASFFCQVAKSIYCCRNICQWCHRFLFIGSCTIQVVFINQWILCKYLLKLLVHCVRLGLVETKVILGASLGADYGSDHQFLITKFRLKLKKIVKNTRPARYDSNKITYEFTVEVMNRFKGLDLDNSVPEELWTEVHNTI